MKKLTNTALTKEQTAELRSLLGKQWIRNNGETDERMVKHCLNDYRYLFIDGQFVQIIGSKPTIHSVMYYDDETEGPNHNYAAFVAYNESHTHLDHYKKMANSWGDYVPLVIGPAYWGDRTDGKLASVGYSRTEEVAEGYRKVTDEELILINQVVDEVKEDYLKRLDRYFKRYSDKICSSGYWANR